MTAYGNSNELVAEVDGLVVENVDPATDKKMEVFLETLLLVAAADGPELGSKSLCGQHRMQSRSRCRIFDQYLLDGIPLKEAHRGAGAASYRVCVVPADYGIGFCAYEGHPTFSAGLDRLVMMNPTRR